MALESGLKVGLLNGLKTGMVSLFENPNWAVIRTGGGAALMSAMGLTGQQAPAALYLFETSTTVGTDRVGSATLSGSGLTAVVDSKLGGTCLQWDASSTDEMIAANSTPLNVTTGGVAVLVVTALTAVPGGTQCIAGKLSGSDTGYALNVTAGGALLFDCRQVSSETRTSAATTYANGNAFVAIGGVDRARTNEIFVVSDREARVEANLTLATLTTTAAFAVGRSGNNTAAAQHCRLVAVWTTLPATTFTQAHCQTLKSYLGI